MRLLLALPVMLLAGLFAPDSAWAACQGCEFDYDGEGYVCMPGCPVSGPFWCGEDCAISPSTGMCWEINPCPRAGVTVTADGVLLATALPPGDAAPMLTRTASSGGAGIGADRVPDPLSNFRLVTFGETGSSVVRACDGALIARVLSEEEVSRSEQTARVLTL